MKRTFATGLALISLACAASSPAPIADPIPRELLCPREAAEASPTISDPAACLAATQKRLERIQRTVLERWDLTPDSKPHSIVQLQFNLDAEGRPQSACVLGGTGASEARAALAALATYQPRKPLSARERCALGQPLVSTFTTEPGQ